MAEVENGNEERDEARAKEREEDLQNEVGDVVRTACREGSGARDRLLDFLFGYFWPWKVWSVWEGSGFVGRMGGRQRSIVCGKVWGVPHVRGALF